MAKPRKKKEEQPVANTVMDFVVEAPPVPVFRPKPVKVNGEDYFLVKTTSLDKKHSEHPVTGWKLSSWIKFYNGLNSITNVEYELTTKSVYDKWMYSPVEDEETKVVDIKIGE